MKQAIAPSMPNSQSRHTLTNSVHLKKKFPQPHDYSKKNGPTIRRGNSFSGTMRAMNIAPKNIFSYPRHRAAAKTPAPFLP
ncbi:hypothetical protein, partial [Undibacterium sp.]|uniref:hypothetical protein n=1 Tax=Undibacterium sp. TaxID=1914977 RepID=UPI00374CC3E6